jgi:AraC family transcriptional regulator
MENSNPVFRSLEIIEKRISEKLTVENIAADVFISKYHYMRRFREIVGDSVMEYVTKRKIALAAAALLETDTGILDIALDYGYDSRDGFSRSFKAYMGVTPTEYRRRGLAAGSQKSVKER